MIFKQNSEIDFFANLITFLSIIFGFQMTAFSILFSSKSLSTFATLYNDEYKNRLLQLSTYFKFSFLFELLFIFLVFVAEMLKLTYLLVTPIFAIVSWCSYKILKVLFEFFETPRNQ